MTSYSNFQNKSAKYTSDRSDIYESAFESPYQKSEKGMNAIDKHLDELLEFCSFIKWYPDIFWDMYKPETGGLNFDLYQRVMMRQLSRFPENYFCIPRGGSKCVSGDTLLFTSEGIKEIGELFNYCDDNREFEQTHKITLLNRHGQLETSGAGVYSGYKQTKKINTDLGYEIETSFNHPILVMTKEGALEYKKSEDIVVGDYLPISRNNNIWGNETKISYDLDSFVESFSNQGKWQLTKNGKLKFPTTLTKEFSLILGYLIGDGCLTRDDMIMFTNEDDDILNNYISFFTENVGANVKQKDEINFNIYSKLLREYFRQIGLEQVGAFEKVVPRIILNSTKENVSYFLKGLFDTDGCVTSKNVQYCTASQKLSKQVQILLLNFGIIAFRQKYYNKQFKTYHYKIIISSHHIDKFNAEIGFSCKRKQSLLNKYCEVKRNPNKDIIPYQQTHISNICPKGYTRDKFYHVIKGNNNLTYQKLELVFDIDERFENKDTKDFKVLKEIYNLNYYYAKVTDIADSENHLYDLNMPETNSFIGNGFVNHNTLIHILEKYHAAVCYPNITLTITSSTKENAVKIWKEKHDEIVRFYPSFAENFRSVSFTKDTGRVEFVNGAIIDNLSNSQSSKGLRRRRGGLEESALIDKDLYEDAIEPIFNIPRTTMSGEIDPLELNGQINRFSTSGYKNSDEYEKILTMSKNMTDLKGSSVFGCDWFIPVHFGRQKKSVIDKARRGNIVRFRQNYLCDWIGASDGALINISKMIKARVLSTPELFCPRDKNKNFELNEYVIGMDVARSSSDANNKSAIVVLKIIRNQSGSIRQIQLVNIITPPNGLNFEEQSIIVKRVFYQYGGNLDLAKSRVKAVVVDGNSIGQGIVEKLLEDVTDYETNEELGCWGTINTDDTPKVKNAPPILYVLKSQGINGDIIREFINSVESNKLKMIKPFEDIKGQLDKSIDDIAVESLSMQTQALIDEVANLKLKQTQTTYTIEQVVKRIDKDRYSALAYSLYYIAMFLEREDKEDEFNWADYAIW